MKKILILLSLFYFAGCSTQTITNKSDAPQVTFYVDVNDYSNDLFHVTVNTSGLDEENDIYNLPATVPGTYSNLNFGRFVKSIKGFDKDGNELLVKKISENRWQINNVEKLAKLVYESEDTFDSNIKNDKIMPMGGTSISNEYVLLNTFGVMGYFEGLQSNPVKVKVDYKSDWTMGTSLMKDEKGYFYAETYDRLADSPMLIGDLTNASTSVNDIKVGVYVYSPDSTINANYVLNIADKILQSSAKFIGSSPVSHYNFLMCFLGAEDFQQAGIMGAGALEHSYSSLYVYPLMGMGGALNQLQDAMAHEFLHILTPLNLHSEIIQPYNFEVPTSSQHIWLYEGVTEWASDIMQLRGGLIDANEFLKRVTEKANISDRFRQDVSLTEASKYVYSDSLQMQFFNFYNKGSNVAALLDIRLLELSNGNRGFKEVFLSLLNKFGKNKPFPENQFFDVLVEETYPEIREFINDYIIGTKPLPYKEYFAQLGFDYIEERPSEDTRPMMGLQMGMNDKQELILADPGEQGIKAGLQAGDVFYKALGEEVTMQTARKLFGQMSAMSIGDTIEVAVKRDGKEVTARIPLQRRIDRHIFVEMEKPSEHQKFLRDVWERNL